MSGSARSMAWFLNFAIRNQLNGLLKHFLGDARIQALQPHLAGDRGIKSNPQLEKIFMQSCEIPGVLPALRSALATYNITDKHVIRFKPGVFPEVSNVQQWVARVAACMADPELQEDLHAMANAMTHRLGVQEPALRINNTKPRILEKITTEFINNPDFVPQSNPSVQEWCVTCVFLLLTLFMFLIHS